MTEEYNNTTTRTKEEFEEILGCYSTLLHDNVVRHLDKLYDIFINLSNSTGLCLEQDTIGKFGSDFGDYCLFIKVLDEQFLGWSLDDRHDEALASGYRAMIQRRAKDFKLQLPLVEIDDKSLDADSDDNTTDGIDDE